MTAADEAVLIAVLTSTRRVVHDVNNALSTIVTTAWAMNAAPSPGDLEEIQRAAARAAAILRSIPEVAGATSDARASLKQMIPFLQRTRPDLAFTVREGAAVPVSDVGTITAQAIIAAVSQPPGRATLELDLAVIDGKATVLLGPPVG